METTKRFLLHELVIYKKLFFECLIAPIVFDAYLKKSPLSGIDRESSVLIASFAIEVDSMMRIKAWENKKRKLTLKQAVSICWMCWTHSPELGIGYSDTRELWEAILRPIMPNINYCL